MSELFDDQKKSTAEFIDIGDDWWVNVANILFIRPVKDADKIKMKIQFNDQHYIITPMSVYEEKIKPHLNNLLKSSS